MSDHVTKAEVIPFAPDCVGVYLTWESGRLSAYAVPNVLEAVADLKRLKVDRNITWKM